MYTVAPPSQGMVVLLYRHTYSINVHCSMEKGVRNLGGNDKEYSKLLSLAPETLSSLVTLTSKAKQGTHAPGQASAYSRIQNCSVGIR